MLILDKQNIIPYLQAHCPDFCKTGPITVCEIGDSEEDITKDAETVASYLGTKNAPPAFSHDNKSSGAAGNLDGAYMALLGDLTK